MARRSPSATVTSLDRLPWWRRPRPRRRKERNAQDIAWGKDRHSVTQYNADNLAQSAPLRTLGPSRPRPLTATDPDPAPQLRQLTLGSRPISYTVRTSRRARLLRLVIHPDRGLEVVIPIGASQQRIEQVLASKSAWIARTLDRMERERAAAAPPPLHTGRILPFAGGRLRLVVTTGASEGRYRAARTGDTLAIVVHNDDHDTIRRALEAWYRREARAIFASRLVACNAVYGYSYARVSIKEQKSRWGSCSRRGNLNFNWRLLLAPLPVLDYVVVHELCHLKELNHSERFWRLVARGCPDYQTYRRWLRDNGRTLVF